MKSFLPPLRALQAFEAFGRLGSVSSAAQELGVTSGAISQQLKVLEEHLGAQVVFKDGRRAALTPEARSYHEMIAIGFDRLRAAQDVWMQQQSGVDLKVSGVPTLLLKWLNPQLHHFQAMAADVPIRLEAAHAEPDPQMLGQMFRLTYGAVASRLPHSRPLFTDICFPVCAPEFLERHPEARSAEGLAGLPLIEIDWGPAYTGVPRWRDWFAARGVDPGPIKPIAVHSLSSLALEAAAGGQGVTLAQLSFASFDLQLGRLVRLSEDALRMPEPYYVCWGNSTLDQPNARAFLNWLINAARALPV
ncbi:LysR substrate-binding domain-containing protein [Sulfitobacter aestuarii]|uniref:LysR substrate-binding domain-containing protein n=1 Tax=Sulfitobacter aestuarii TaxID=2161676 RepID=A0ABW5U0F4_9RHOB